MFILPPNLFQVFTLKHPSALDGHTHSTVPTHTVPKHAGPSGHPFIPQVGTPHVCAPHTVPLTIVNFHGHMHTRFQQSPIFHLIVIDFAPAHCILGLSLPNSTLLSNFLLLTFHTIVDFCTHMHPPNAYGPPPSTLHWFFHLFTINQLQPTLPMSYACSTVAWGVLRTVVG